MVGEKMARNGTWRWFEAEKRKGPSWGGTSSESRGWLGKLGITEEYKDVFGKGFLRQTAADTQN